ncbi:DNA pilot protein [Sigmofec virus UA08Rod_6706]|uniref:DNA pilot protein n=1 Tax=Sigmofec virus UA08Rod_6706 TaxID=2929237 RepID=A0A976N0I9_9VIRU|nr:DNA pilot protein [Sigmofec virus UA08Rod_6706]
MLPIYGAALISGAGSLLGDLLGFGSTLATNKANKEIMSYQHDLNLDMWNRNNEYNHPTQQMARLHSAGLNPNLIYGSGSAISASSQPSGVSAIPQQSYQGFGDLGASAAVQTYMQAKVNEAQIKNLDVRTQRESLEAIGQAIKNSVSQNEADHWQELFDRRLGLMDSEIDRNNASAEASYSDALLFGLRNIGLQLDNEQKQKNIDYTGAQIKQIESNIEMAKKRLPYEIDALSAQAGLSRAQTAKTYKECLSIAEDIKNKIRDGKIKDQKVLGETIENEIKKVTADTKWVYFIFDLLGTALHGASVLRGGR